MRLTVHLFSELRENTLYALKSERAGHGAES